MANATGHNITTIKIQSSSINSSSIKLTAKAVTYPSNTYAGTKTIVSITFIARLLPVLSHNRVRAAPLPTLHYQHPLRFRRLVLSSFRKCSLDGKQSRLCYAFCPTVVFSSMVLFRGIPPASLRWLSYQTICASIRGAVSFLASFRNNIRDERSATRADDISAIAVCSQIVIIKFKNTTTTAALMSPFFIKKSLAFF